MNPNNYVTLNNTWKWPCGSATMNNWTPWDLEMHRNQENANANANAGLQSGWGGCADSLEQVCHYTDLVNCPQCMDWDTGCPIGRIVQGGAACPTTHINGQALHLEWLGGRKNIWCQSNWQRKGDTYVCDDRHHA